MNQPFTNDSIVASQTAQLNAITNYGLYISDKIYNIVQLYIVIGLGSFLSILATCANLIIVLVYCSQGVKASVTVSYIALALADAGLCFLTFCVIICGLIDVYFPLQEVNFAAVSFVYVAYIRAVTHMLSTVITVYLSVELCICITIPLKVKLMFTKTRSIIINLALLVTCLAANCPAWATQQLTCQFNPRFNRSRLTLFFTGGRYGVEIYLGIFNGNTVPIAGQIVSIICAVILISGVKKSVQFRKQVYTDQGAQKGIADLMSNGVSVKMPSVAGKQTVAIDKYSKLAKVTVLITVVFLVCNIPVMVVSMTKTVLPGLMYNLKLYSILYFAMYASTLINSGGNFIVYFYASQKFRTTFLTIFCGSKRTFGRRERHKS